MEIYENLNTFSEKNRTVVTLGNFDGVHIGHKKIIGKVVELSKKYSLPSVVFTFKNHPMNFFGAKIDIIFPESKKISAFEELGVDYLLNLDFDEKFANMNPEVFIREFLSKKLKASYIVVGYDYRFGKKRQGDFELLNLFGSKYGYTPLKIEKVEIDNITVSSTNIRNYLKEGQLCIANRMLGRCFEIEGQVKEGDSIGRLLGYPTANIDFSNYIIPKYGVYITKTVVDGKQYPSLTNVGVRPTIKQNGELKVETYLLDFDRNIYSQQISVKFIKYLRMEMSFPSFDELKAKIDEDIKIAREYFKYEDCTY